MIKVYIANDPVHAHLLEEILESNGIQAVVRDEQAFNLRGELPVVYPSLWTSEESAVAARKICVDFDHLKKDAGKQGSWVCPECGETISAEFTDCWKCAKSDEASSLETAPNAGEPQRKSSFLKWVLGIVIALIVLFMTLSYRQARHAEVAKKLHSAVTLMRADEPEKALKVLDEAVEQEPGWGLLYYNRAVTFGRLSQHENARRDYQRALDLHYHKPEVIYVNRARHYDFDHIEDALADCTKSIGIAPTAHAYNLRAYYEHFNGHIEAAKNDLDYALRVEPGNSYAHALRGYICIGSGLFSDAEKHASLAAGCDPNKPYANLVRGEISIARGQLDDAISQFSRALEKEHRDTEALSRRGDCYYAKGLLDQAMSDYSTALSYDSNTFLAMQGRAKVFRLQGDKSRFDQELDRIVATKPYRATDFIFRAWAWAEKGDMSLAMKDAEIAETNLSWSCYAELGYAAIYVAHARTLGSASTGTDAQKDDIDKAFEHLQAAGRKGFSSWQFLTQDPDFKIIVNDPRFEPLRSKFIPRIVFRQL